MFFIRQDEDAGHCGSQSAIKSEWRRCRKNSFLSHPSASQLFRLQNIRHNKPSASNTSTQWKRIIEQPSLRFFCLNFTMIYNNKNKVSFSNRFSWCVGKFVRYFFCWKFCYFIKYLLNNCNNKKQTQTQQFINLTIIYRIFVFFLFSF